MSAQLYFHSSVREMHSERIEIYVNIYFERIVPQFLNIEEEADKYADQLFNQFMSTPCDKDGVIDPSDFAESARNSSISLYENLSITKYNIRVMYISTLYQIWEQQVRKFLFDELSHNYKIQFVDFCTKIEKIKSEFLNFNYNIEDMKCWSTINELRLLSNVIKHGDGISAKQLYKVNPNLFNTRFSNDLDIDIFKTTLNDETLKLDDDLLIQFKESLIKFWYEFPERLYE